MIDADYVIVGAGAVGMAFADTLVAAERRPASIIVDRRAATRWPLERRLSVRAAARPVGRPTA
jgi:pyrroline-5-carboxylate reductase